jgi:hypothetical protein
VVQFHLTLVGGILRLPKEKGICRHHHLDHDYKYRTFQCKRRHGCNSNLC